MGLILLLLIPAVLLIVVVDRRHMQLADRADAENARWLAGDPFAMYGCWLPDPMFQPRIVGNQPEKSPYSAESAPHSAESAGTADFNEVFAQDRRTIAAIEALSPHFFTDLGNWIGIGPDVHTTLALAGDQPGAHELQVKALLQLV